MLKKLEKIINNPIKYVFIIIKNDTDKKLQLLLTICNINNVKVFQNEKILILINNNINIIDIIFINDIIKTLDITQNKFKLYLILVNDNINALKINSIKITYKEEFIIKYIKYDYLNIFFKNKLLLKDLFFKQNNKICNVDELFIKIENFQMLNIKLYSLLNLFILYGNIEQLFYNYVNGNIYLKYESIYSNKKLIKFKNKFIFKNKIIEVKIVKESLKNCYPILFKKNINIFYNKFSNIKFNNPSNKILIFNISINTKLHYFYTFLLNYSKPSVIKFINNSNKIFKMCIAGFKSINEANQVIIKLNNTWFLNNKIKIIYSINQILI